MTGLHAALLALVLTGAGPEEGPVLLDFSATWCGPCQAMVPTIDQLIAQGYPVRKLDYDRNRDLANRFGVTEVPCFIMTVGGRETAKALGPRSIGQLQEMFDEAQKLAPPRQLPEPGGAPIRLVSTPKTLPIPSKQASAALNLETQPLERVKEPRGPMPPASLASLNRSTCDEQLIAATVRLRVFDSLGPSIGTGTIIDAREGRALVLTCGHIFRDYREGGNIEVDLFGSGEKQTVSGRLLAFDEQRDVGLLTIRCPGPVKAARVAPRNYAVEVGTAVVNVGCNHGEDPTVRRSKVTAQDKYMGPANTEVGGLPVPGRSGGGLFSIEGLVIGVCNAADPECNEGIYAALDSIHQQLDEANLAFIFDEKATSPVKQATLVEVEEPSMSKSMPEANAIQLLTESRDNLASAPVRKGVANSLTPEEQRLVDELRRRRAEGAEIVCIVRTKESPDSQSEVFLFENASPQLVQQLATEGFTRR